MSELTKITVRARVLANMPVDELRIIAAPFELRYTPEPRSATIKAMRHIDRGECVEIILVEEFSDR